MEKRGEGVIANLSYYYGWLGKLGHFLRSLQVDKALMDGSLSKYPTS
jgi:hypothetical protein